MRTTILTIVLLTLAIGALPAAVGLTTVPKREKVKLTIYNAVDLTLAQEQRDLVLKKGVNRIQYQWAGTLIDATSIRLVPKAHQDEIEIVDIVYPPNAPATLVWNIESQVEGAVPFEISYFTSGLSWSADYVLRAGPDEATADVEGTVAVINHSGEDYPAAEVRLVLGSINLVEEIRDLATRQLISRQTMELGRRDARLRGAMEKMRVADDAVLKEELKNDAKRPQVVSQRLADYHIFTIGGIQPVTNGATSRFLAIETEEAMALENLYRVDLLDEQACKLYRFINDEEHHLPKDGPLPDGTWNVFRVTDIDQQTLSFLGRCAAPYIPPGQKVELALGVDPAIAVRQRQVDERQTDFHYNGDNRVDGWIQHRSFTLKLVNTKPIPVSLEYLVQTGGGDWAITGLAGERRDVTLYRHQHEVEAGATYEPPAFTISTRHGWLAQRPEEQKPGIRVPALIELPAVVTE